MNKPYEPPALETIGTVEELTLQGGFDKVGSAVDQYTPTIPALDGTVFPD
jgi:hypothetical protein